MSDNIYKCNTRTLQKILPVILEAGLVPFIQSSPGMGKSSVINALAENYGLCKIDHRVSTSEPTDFTGLPNLENGEACMAPFTDIFPLDKPGMNPPEGKNGWILLLDEFNHGSKSVQAASYKLVLDRMVGQYHLHPNCAIVLAGNLASDRAMVNNLSTALQSRVIHLFLELDFKVWLEDVAIAQGYHPTVKAFLNANPSRLMNFDPDHTDSTFCCPRTWEFLNRQVQQTNGPVEWMLPAYVGTIGTAVAVEFYQFCRVFDSMARVEDILKNPHGVPVPTDKATTWAIVCSMTEWCNADTFSALGTYANRLPMDMKVFFFRSVMLTHPELRREPAFLAASQSIASLLS